MKKKLPAVSICLKAEAYLDSSLVAILRKERSNFVIKVFDTLDEPSMITKAPLS